MNDQPKKMLSYDEMITKLKDKGITFNIMSEREATDFLRDNNYFFKLISYRVNFKKDPLTDKYIGLDFAYLVDLAAIDAAIRRFLSPITLNVEHGCKVRILKKITENDEIDGYNIVNKLKLSDNSYSRKAYEKTIDFLKENQYETKLYNNYKNNIPIWVLIESMTFGALTQFWNFYRDEYAPGSSDVKTLSVHLQSAKKIRNAVAHSNPLLINLDNDAGLFPYKNNTRRRKSVKDSILNTGKNQIGLSNEDLQYMKIADLSALFYLNKRLTSPVARKHTKSDGYKLLERFEKHPDYYKPNNPINTFKKQLKKMIDFQ